MAADDKEMKLANILKYFGYFILAISFAAAVILLFIVENFEIPAIILIVGGVAMGLLFMSLSANLKILMDVKELLRKQDSH